MRGGKREGAGRKPNGDSAKIAYSVRLSSHVIAYLKSSENAARTIELAIVRSAGFKQFKNRSK